MNTLLTVPLDEPFNKVAALSLTHQLSELQYIQNDFSIVYRKWHSILPIPPNNV